MRFAILLVAAVLISPQNGERRTYSPDVPALLIHANGNAAGEWNVEERKAHIRRMADFLIAAIDQDPEGVARDAKAVLRNAERVQASLARLGLPPDIFSLDSNDYVPEVGQALDYFLAGMTGEGRVFIGALAPAEAPDTEPAPAWMRMRSTDEDE